MEESIKTPRHYLLHCAADLRIKAMNDDPIVGEWKRLRAHNLLMGEAHTLYPQNIK